MKHNSSPFKGRHYPPEVILLCIRWYCRYQLSYRDVEEMMHERGLDVDHSTVFRWVQLYAPEINKRMRQHLKMSGTSGAELKDLHLMDKTIPTITRYPITGDNIVEKVAYTEPIDDKGKVLFPEANDDKREGRVWINTEQYFEGVPREVWSFQVGGYQVCQKWLKDRKGRKLAYDDLTHYQHIVSALTTTISLMKQIDKVIEAHNGIG